MSRKRNNFILTLAVALCRVGAVGAEDKTEISVPLRQTSPSPADVPLWGFVTGIPIPRGTLDSARHAKLVDVNGNDMHAHFEALAHWSPTRESIRWLRVEFTAPTMIAQAPKYQLVFGRGVRGSFQPNPIQITQDPYSLAVSTGPLRFTLDKKRGGILSGVTRFGRKVYTAENTDGPYVEDDTGAIYRAAFDQRANIVVEELGPVRAVVRVESWHVRDLSSGTTPFSPAGVRLNKSITRYYAYAGLPCVEVDWTFVVTADTELVRFKDIGLRLSGSREARVGLDSEKDIELSDGYLLQKKADQFVVRQLRGNSYADLATGTKAPGWFATKNLAVTMRDFWQTFPHELEVSQSTLIVHAWPGHGEYNADWFIEPSPSPATNVAPTEITGPNGVKLNPAYFSSQQKWHHGPLLDFRYPRWWRQPNLTGTTDNPGWLPDDVAAGMGNGIATGTSRTQQLLLDLSGESSDRIAARRALFLARPHVWLKDPQWLADSHVLGPMNVDVADTWDDATLKNWEALDRAGYYGMWLWGNMPESIGPNGLPLPYRQVNGSSHHGFFNTHWLLYACTGRAAHLRYARANTAHWRDIGLVHYSTPELEARKDGGAQIAGAAHAVGFYPWRSGTRDTVDSGVFPLLMDFYLTGDRRSLEAADQHDHSLLKNAGIGGFTRECGGNMKTLLDWYRHGWDAEAGEKIDATIHWLATNDPDGSKGNESPLNWTNFMPEYLDLTQYPDIPLKHRKELLEYVKAWTARWVGTPTCAVGYAANPGNMLAAAWFATGDARYLQPFQRSVSAGKLPREQWLLPKPPGFGSGAQGAVYFDQVLYAYAAWRQAVERGIVSPDKRGSP